MTPEDLVLRRDTYRLVVEMGRVPTAQELAAATGRDVEAVREGWSRLHDAHAVVLHDDRSEIRMANPFSAVPTPYRVTADGRDWFANCAWDAFGICAALGVDGRIRTTCADCGTPLAVDVQGQQPSETDLVFHCLVPASMWWDDIVFT